MNKFLNEATLSILSYPTTSTGGSASTTAGVDMAKYANVTFEVIGHRLPDAKGEGVGTMTVYEHTASAWTGVATVLTASIVTQTINSVSDSWFQKELKATQLSDDKRYLYVAMTLPTGVVLSATAIRTAPRFEPQD